MKRRIIATLLMAACCYGGGTLVSALVADRPLPRILASVLARVKARTSVPVLLPGELPEALSDAKHAIVEKATSHEYVVELYDELGAGNAGFAASFKAKDDPRYSPRELPNTREVRLAKEVVGFFRPVSCGGSCAPANIWWKQGSVLYQIQLKLSSTLRENRQQSIMIQVADSAILAGPR
jgi:hypothetical protein